MELETNVTLSNILNGAVEEVFQEKLAEIMENINDPNTKGEKVRKLHIVVSIKPDENRRTMASEISCETKLAEFKPIKTYFHLEKSGSKFTLNELKSSQPGLPMDVKPDDFQGRE